MYERVLVGTDGSESATRAVESAARLAGLHDAELIVGHGFSTRLTGAQRRWWAVAPAEHRWRYSPGTIAEATVDSAVARARDVAGDSLVVTGVCTPGDPVPVLVDAARRVEADLLVIGNRSRRIERAVCRRAPCDVLVVDTTGRREGTRARVAGRLEVFNRRRWQLRAPRAVSR